MLLIGIIACILLYKFFRNASPAKMIGWLIVYSALVALGILSAKYPSIEGYIDSSFSAVLRFMFWYFLFFLPLLPFRWFYNFVTTNLTPWPWIQILVLILWAEFLVAAIWALVFEKNRVRLFNWLRERVGPSAPLAYSFNLIWIAIFFFSSVTLTLLQSRALSWIGPASQKITPGAIMDFYLWHFLDAVPVFKINDTLPWKEPLTYTNAGIGLLLLLFKIVVISPIIGAFIWYWRNIGKENVGKQETSTNS